MAPKVVLKEVSYANVLTNIVIIKKLLLSDGVNSLPGEESCQMGHLAGSEILPARRRAGRHYFLHKSNLNLNLLNP